MKPSRKRIFCCAILITSLSSIAFFSLAAKNDVQDGMSNKVKIGSLISPVIFTPYEVNHKTRNVYISGRPNKAQFVLFKTPPSWHGEVPYGLSGGFTFFVQSISDADRRTIGDFVTPYLFAVKSTGEITPQVPCTEYKKNRNGNYSQIFNCSFNDLDLNNDDHVFAFMMRITPQTYFLNTRIYEGLVH